MAKFWIRYSGHGNADSMDWESIEVATLKDAWDKAWERARDDFENYAHGYISDEDEEGLSDEGRAELWHDVCESVIDYQATSGFTYEVEYTNGTKGFEDFAEDEDAKFALHNDHVYDYKKVE